MFVRTVCFSALLLAGTASLWHPLGRLASYCMSHEEYSHIPLIPAVAAILLFTERKRIFPRLRSSPAAGVAVIAFAIVTYLVGQYFAGSLNENDYVAVIVCALVLFCLGAFLVCYGAASFRRAVFPLLFLFLMVPLPSRALDWTILHLQKGSSAIASAGFRVLGIPIYRQGFVFALPGLTIEVARECSGIRSSLALFITTLLAVRFLIRSPVARVLLCLSVVPIAMLKNGIRIVTIATLAAYLDPGFLSGPLHRRGGVVFFLLGLLVIWFELRLVEAYEARRQPRAMVQAAAAN